MVNQNYFSLSILMPLNGESGTKNFSDYSYFNTVFNVVGMPKLSSAKSKFRESSLYFDGSFGYVGWGDHLGSGVVGAVEKLIGRGDFTVEMWVNTDNYSTQRPFFGVGKLGSSRSIVGSAMSMYFNQSGQLCFWSTWGEIFGGVQAVAGAWYHVALCRSAGTLRLFLNGTQQGSSLFNDVVLVATDFALGATVDVDYHANKFKGYIAEFRVYRDIGLYTANFATPGKLDVNTAQVAHKLAGVRRAISLAMPSVKSKVAWLASSVSNKYHGGFGRIVGVVDRAGPPLQPVRCRVRLHRRRDGMVVLDTFSDANGGYEFKNIAAQSYYVSAFDPLSTSNAVIADQVTPEVI